MLYTAILKESQANLEKQVKELNVRIVDLETKSYASSPRPATNSRRMESRIEELTNQLNQTNRDKTDTSRLHRSADKIARDAKLQLAEADRQRAKLEEERRNYEAQITSLRTTMDAMVREQALLSVHADPRPSKPTRMTSRPKIGVPNGRPSTISRKPSSTYRVSPEMCQFDVLHLQS